LKSEFLIRAQRQSRRCHTTTNLTNENLSAKRREREAERSRHR